MAVQPVAVPVAANDNPWYRRLALPIGMAVAASLAAVLLITPRDMAAPPRDLSFALETSRSGETVRLADGTDLTPILTVQAADGRYCREYRAQQTRGLACRNPKGSWSVAASGPGGTAGETNGIAVAAGPSGASLDTVYRQLGVSDPFDANAEDRLLRSGWSPR